MWTYQCCVRAEKRRGGGVLIITYHARKARYASYARGQKHPSLPPPPASRIAYTIDRPPPISPRYQIFTLASRRALPRSTLREEGSTFHGRFVGKVALDQHGNIDLFEFDSAHSLSLSFPSLEIYTRLISTIRSNSKTLSNCDTLFKEAIFA